MTPFFAEYIGTLLLILIGNGTAANLLLTDTNANKSRWILIPVGWGLGTFAAVQFAAPYSGAHLNPAITLALALAGKFPWTGVYDYLLAQITGAFSGMLLVWLIYADHFNRTDDPEAIRKVFFTVPAIRNYWTNITAETTGAFILAIAVLYVKSGTLLPTGTPTGLGSIGALAAALLVGGLNLGLGGSTGCALNPVRDLMPRIVYWACPIPKNGNCDWGYSWVPATGALLGGGLAALLYLSRP
jgi:glycerol uptake facilitator protein